MNKETEERIAAQTAKILALMCVRNTYLESIHSGQSPVSKTGDFSDVKIIEGGRARDTLDRSFTD